MKMSALLIPLGLLVATPAMAGPAPAASARHSEASIPFADHGGVDDWRAGDSHTIYFRDNHRQWYRAELMSPSYDLPYVEDIGIDTRPNGTLDKFGAVIVKGQRYQIASFERVDGPPSKGSKGLHRIDAAKAKLAK
ncbi:DUF6491 family protein [Novosphingobium sp. KN65.2]|uniref:DUF6491 family protein n=1 Tax=Novosphingobium sp. KN65.2 TaxID=1478134 RepID=UPI0005E10151|nr:DUF6491 family protein [Novosphingobium sp. KN65.2]CDO38088.1 conserved exported hypothetical protein [Novosphingobium sp. KN65.2]